MVICCHFTKVIRNVKSNWVVTCVFIILRMNKVKYRNKNVRMYSLRQGLTNILLQCREKATKLSLHCLKYICRPLEKCLTGDVENFHEHVIEFRQVKKCHCLCKSEVKDILDKYFPVFTIQSGKG